MVVFKRRSGIMRKLIPFVLSIPFTCFALGMVIGKANSPDYSSETSAHLYVREHAKPVKADAEDVVLEARAGTKVYTYSLKAGSLTHRIEMGKQSIERSWKTVGYKQISEILGLPSFASSLASVPGLLKEGRRWRHPETALVATVAAIGLAVGYYGYHLTYSDEPDFDHDSFKRGLEDRSVWQSVAQAVGQR